MLVSVIMGVYNAEFEKAFFRSIASILEQKIENADIEFIICDDGSTDKTYSMLLAESVRSKKMILLKNEKNMGLGAALNRCIEASNGEILVRQDIDDFSNENRIAELLAEFNKNLELAIVGSEIILYEDALGFVVEYQTRKYPSHPKSRDFLFSVPFMHGAVAMRKSAVLAVGGYSTSRLCKRNEDYELFMRMYSMGYKGLNIQKPLYIYKEDLSAMKRRKYRYRFNEAYVRYKGFCSLKLMPSGIIYVIKPFAVGLIPKKLLCRLKEKYRGGSLLES